MSQTTRTRTRPFVTDAPQISAAQVARLRTLARDYVRAGGGVFPNANQSQDEWSGNAAHIMHGRDGTDRFGALLKQHVTDYEPHEALWSAGMDAVGDQSVASFVFGALVGLEYASLVCGHALPVSDKTPTD